MTRLSLTSLSLNNFRNYAYARFEVGAAPVVLTGSNGAGKTNILEAISFLSPGRGLRRAKLAEIDNAKTGESWVVAAHLNTPQGEVQIGTGRDVSDPDSETDKRIIKLDGKPLKSQAELSKLISIIWLTPQMDQLFLEGGSARRKFLDRLVYWFDSEHSTRINAYETAMRERNRLLSEYGADPIWLNALEHKMAETGAAIAAARISAISKLNAVMEHSNLAFPKAHLTISGFVEDRLQDGAAAVTVEQAFAEMLAGARREDAGAGRTLSGIHRSELTVVHQLKQMEAARCSTGEQKALLLSIILADARAQAESRGRVPLILLDEVVAHLDAGRRAELFQEILDIGAQAWLTGTDESLFENLQQKAQFFEVKNGAILPR